MTGIRGGIRRRLFSSGRGDAAGRRAFDVEHRPFPGLRRQSAQVFRAGGEDRRALARHRHARRRSRSTSHRRRTRSRSRNRKRAMFRACGITGFHNSIGTGGPDARRGDADIPRRVAGLRRPQRATSSRWSGGVGSRPRQGAAQDRGDHGRCRTPSISATAEGRQGVLPARAALRAAHLQHAEPPRLAAAPIASTAASATSAPRSSRR